ncbi:hypothetical protein [Silanimonas sp.]|uniref:hypothetical protein n=1 Tax=Silanimonas sp. TaxID=1929290 RepID=UPI0022CAC086|nr:hypothetical protein [Silanimonas sp.]MCZ8115478.1 hypothetical protein [Silanimonas sp.]
MEIERCARCRGRLAILASIEAPAVIARILAHLAVTAPERYPAAPSVDLPVGARASPRTP